MNILGFIKESKWFQRTTYGEIYLDIEINEKGIGLNDKVVGKLKKGTIRSNSNG